MRTLTPTFSDSWQVCESILNMAAKQEHIVGDEINSTFQLLCIEVVIRYSQLCYLVESEGEDVISQSGQRLSSKNK